MGCASSTVENADLAVAVASKEIDRALYAERKALETQKVVKLLLLGTGEAGKSTILKQMKIIYGSGFTEDDLRIYRSAIIMNAVHCTKALISGMDQLEIPYGFIPPTPDEIKSFLSTPSEDLFRAEQQGAPMQQEDSVPSEKREAMQTLWRDSGVQYCASRGKEFQLMESCPYLMNHLARICHPSYAPTETDILSMRVMTTSISETRFLVKNVTYRVFDVGGQRSQRKKWAPLFDDVDAIIFVAAIGQYDQVCYEARDTNRGQCSGT
ncbi:guanine nucleotide binding protein, alpha subunit [Chytriomyces sp. MP71]|nr:guanine nucleotide binding protein, alpha subunit [Chytriomyces sp. MP71]